VAEDSHHLGYIPSGQTDFVRSLTANEFPYRCTAFIEAHEDENDGHKFFVGYVYIKRLD
jgi:cell division protein FtsW (lipid II flippase)